MTQGMLCMGARWGLRSKSAVALLLACVVALIPALLFGWGAMKDIRDHSAEAYARNLTQLNRQHIAAPISRELALSQRLAHSLGTRQWLQDESSSLKRTRFFDEAEGFRSEFLDKSYFVVVDATRNYYSNTPDSPVSQIRRYKLGPESAADAWYFKARNISDDYQLLVSQNERDQTLQVRFNVLVRDAQNNLLGMTGSDLNLQPFIKAILSDLEPGVEPMLINSNGIIQVSSDAHPAYTQLYDLLTDETDRPALRKAMAEAQREPTRVQTLHAEIQGQPRLLALSYIEPLQWYVLTSVNLNAAHLIDQRWLWLLIISLAALMCVLLLGFGYAVEGLVIRPLKDLQQSAKAIAGGNYDAPITSQREDEIGELSKAFASMSDQVRRHTGELEGKVLERTQELEKANREMIAAHKKIDDSIDYASLIQRAILPDRQLGASLGDEHFVLWKPRDIVGGDFYVYRQNQDGYLLGIFDCAGHGVPGALMTMLARAAIDHAIDVAGEQDPAAILRETDLALRGMLGDAVLSRALATNTDAGLVWLDRSRSRLLFSGAKIALYASDGETVEELHGGRRALGDKRQGEYQNHQLTLHPGWTYYMCTDGFLDQAGGEQGFGFGNRRFTEMLREHARLPLKEQYAVFASRLAEYQGELPQRDDITVLSFRFDPEQ